MSSKKPKPCLVVLDVGHGSAAVLHDEGGTVVIDAGPPGAHVGRHLQALRICRVESMLLSHADADHIGGAITLLLDASVRIDEVLLNSDSAKESTVFQQLCVALVEANHRSKTRINGRLAISTKLQRRGGSHIEVLHPPDTWALAGAGGRSPSGQRLTSNSLSAAVRVTHRAKCSVLLGADIEFSCLDEWKASGISPVADVLVFPHHGGQPGTSGGNDSGLFAYELTQAVMPQVVVFSNHRKKFDNPPDEVLAGVAKANPAARFACTQLPDRLSSRVAMEECWSLHRRTDGTGSLEGSLRVEFMKTKVRCSFEEDSRLTAKP